MENSPVTLFCSDDVLIARKNMNVTDYGLKTYHLSVPELFTFLIKIKFLKSFRALEVLCEYALQIYNLLTYLLTYLL